MSDTARAFGIDGWIEYHGCRYRLAEVGPGIRADFCLYLEDYDRQAIVRFRPYISPEDYSKRMSALIDEVKVGEKYDFFGEYVQDHFKKQWAIEYMVYLQLKYGNPEADISQELAGQICAEKMDDINRVMEMRAQKADPTKATASATSTS